MKGEINYIGVCIVWAVLALVFSWWFISHNKKRSKSGFGLKELSNTVLAAVVASGLMALVYFVYFEYIPNSNPSTCQVDGEPCGVQKGY